MGVRRCDVDDSAELVSQQHLHVDSYRRQQRVPRGSVGPQCEQHNRCLRQPAIKRQHRVPGQFSVAGRALDAYQSHRGPALAAARRIDDHIHRHRRRWHCPVSVQVVCVQRQIMDRDAGLVDEQHVDLDGSIAQSQGTRRSVGAERRQYGRCL